MATQRAVAQLEVGHGGAASVVRQTRDCLLVERSRGHEGERQVTIQKVIRHTLFRGCPQPQPGGPSRLARRRAAGRRIHLVPVHEGPHAIVAHRSRQVDPFTESARHDRLAQVQPLMSELATIPVYVHTRPMWSTSKPNRQASG